MSWIEEQSWFGLEPDDIEDYENMRVESIKVNLLNKQWTTKYGTTIPISKMTTQHIKNTINKIKRENWKIEFLPMLENELKLRNI